MNEIDVPDFIIIPVKEGKGMNIYELDKLSSLLNFCMKNGISVKLIDDLIYKEKVPNDTKPVHYNLKYDEDVLENMRKFYGNFILNSNKRYLSFMTG